MTLLLLAVMGYAWALRASNALPFEERNDWSAVALAAAGSGCSLVIGYQLLSLTGAI